MRKIVNLEQRAGNNTIQYNQNVLLVLLLLYVEKNWIDVNDSSLGWSSRYEKYTHVFRIKPKWFVKGKILSLTHETY